MSELVDLLRKVKHHECEDCWYSCPESAGGCCDDRQEGCTCHAPEMHAAADRIAQLEAEIGKACECFYMMPALNGVPEHFGRQATVDEVRAECSAAIDECLSILEPLIGRRP